MLLQSHNIEQLLGGTLVFASKFVHDGVVGAAQRVFTHARCIASSFSFAVEGTFESLHSLRIEPI